jgi:hypothetical protein
MGAGELATTTHSRTAVLGAGTTGCINTHNPSNNYTNKNLRDSGASENRLRKSG